MALTIPTVKVVNEKAPGGFMIVNASELADEQVLFDKSAEAARRKQMKQVQAAAEAAAAVEAAANSAALQAIKNATAGV